MNRYFFKSSIALVVSFVLLYYSVAWAVLRCSHDEEFLEQEVALQNNADRDLHYMPSNAAFLNLECVCPDYHTELMAGGSSPSQLQGSMPDMTSNIDGFVMFPTGSGYRASDSWLRAVFEKLSSPVFPIGLPRYLSLSNLRI
jgi:hypothetical protein